MRREQKQTNKSRFFLKTFVMQRKKEEKNAETNIHTHVLIIMKACELKDKHQINSRMS